LDIIINKMQRQRCVVRYQIATYSGEVIVYCDADDDNDIIEAKTERLIKQKAGGSLPYGYKCYTIIERKDYFED